MSAQTEVCAAGHMRSAGVRSQRGQAMIEGALVTLLLAALLIGIFDVAQVLFVRQTFTTRARGAARYGAVVFAPTA